MWIDLSSVVVKTDRLIFGSTFNTNVFQPNLGDPTWEPVFVDEIKGHIEVKGCLRSYWKMAGNWKFAPMRKI